MTADLLNDKTEADPTPSRDLEAGNCSIDNGSVLCIREDGGCLSISVTLQYLKFDNNRHK